MEMPWLTAALEKIMKLFVSFFLTFCLLCSSAFAQDAQTPQKYFVKLETTAGNIVLELDYAKAPKTVTNFLRYVRDGYYNGTIFHRVIDGFMIQGGGHLPSLAPKPGQRQPVVNEADNGLKNDVYTVAMARTNDPNSATSQFFINVKDNAFLNHRGKNPAGWGYAVFGKVVEGQDVVDRIKGVKTRTVQGMENVPAEPIVIEKAVVIEK